MCETSVQCLPCYQGIKKRGNVFFVKSSLFFNVKIAY